MRSRCFALATCVAVVLSGCTGTRQGTKKPTLLGIQGSRFTVNRKPTFLLGFSYFGALGAPEEFIRKDLDDFQRRGFNWLRVWATWSGFETNLSIVNGAGHPREPFLGRLTWLVNECDRRGMIVDITLHRGSESSGAMVHDFDSHLRAVMVLVEELRTHRNWFLDLANEHDVRDERFVSWEDLAKLREQVRLRDPQRLVTASFGGHDLTAEDVREALQKTGLDFLCPHRPRGRLSPAETEEQTQNVLRFMRDTGRLAPVLYQEPFRRGYGGWQPGAEDFLKDLAGARKGGAAGWCFHNGSQRGAPDQEPRRSFDLRRVRLFEQLDEEERRFVEEQGTH